MSVYVVSLLLISAAVLRIVLLARSGVWFDAVFNYLPSTGDQFELGSEDLYSGERTGAGGIGWVCPFECRQLNNTSEHEHCRERAKVELCA